MFRLLLLGVLGALAWAYRTVGGPIDGTAWDVHLRRKTIFAFPSSDTLVFQRGQFISEKHLSTGFMPSGYSSSGSDKQESVTWSSTLDGPNSQVLYWQGQIDGNRIQGELSQVDKNGRTDLFTFHGKKKS